MNHHKKKLGLTEKKDFKETEKAHKKSNTLKMTHNSQYGSQNYYYKTSVKRQGSKHSPFGC